MNEREEALNRLRRLETRGNYGSFERSEGRDARDLAFIRTLVLGVVRWRSTLDFLILQLSGRSVEQIDPEVLEILRLGIYQLMEMDVPDYAAVSEMVDLAAKRAPRAKGFVNAVLRKATRSELRAMLPAGQDPRSLGVRWSHPDWLVERWSRAFGRERGERIIKANQELSWPDLLVNTARIAMDELETRLQDRGVACSRSPLVAGVLRLRESTRSVAEEIEAGLVYPMDEGSVIIASLVEPSDRVLDLAAAPGGKSLALALRGAEVISHDVSIERLALLGMTASKMLSRRPRMVVGDGGRPPFRGRFRSVLLDAPCSASGIIRKHPEIRWRLSEELIRRHAAEQRRLLTAALDLTGSICIYSTCSMEPEENDSVVREVLRGRNDFRVAPIQASMESSIAPWIDRGILRLTPDSGADGFTAIRLERKPRSA